MKYNFQFQVPLSLKKELTNELLKEKCHQSLSEAIAPLIKWDKTGSVVNDATRFLEDPKFKAEASIYAYNSDHMEHIIKMLQIIQNFSNPRAANQISEVISELTEK